MNMKEQRCSCARSRSFRAAGCAPAKPVKRPRGTERLRSFYGHDGERFECRERIERGHAQTRSAPRRRRAEPGRVSVGHGDRVINDASWRSHPRIEEAADRDIRVRRLAGTGPTSSATRGPERPASSRPWIAENTTRTSPSSVKVRVGTAAIRSRNRPRRLPNDEPIRSRWPAFR
jgi:hypothetical protein